MMVEEQLGHGALVAMHDLQKDVVFKRPLQPSAFRKSLTKPQKVLDEDSYVEEVGRIIERDFFPDLERLRAKTEYLDAVERNDVIKLRELHLKYTESARGASARLPSPATFETPANIHNSQAPAAPPSEERQEHGGESPTETAQKLSLDEYLNAHTSEDNQSFAEMMAEGERRHRLKYSYLYREEAQSVAEVASSLVLPSIGQQAELPVRKLAVDTWTYRNRNHIMFVPEGVAPPTGTRWRHEVVHGNTRLQAHPFNDSQSKETMRELARQQTQQLDGKIGVDGKELVAGTPRVAGFALMRTPSPRPGAADTPLMTWGEVAGTPLRLDATPAPCFKMRAPPKRELLAMALAERASERHRDKKRRAMDAARRHFASPTPYAAASTRDRFGAMSPAAQRLATARWRLSAAALTPSSPATPKRMDARGHCTPKVKLGIRRPEETLAAHLTDNLLNISVARRQTAADFF